MTEVPGPGNYSPSMRLVEETVVHGISFAGVPVPAEKSLAPGPGNYDSVVSSMAKHGPVFGHEQRHSIETQSTIKNPGPGAYNSPEQSKTSSPKFK